MKKISLLLICTFGFIFAQSNEIITDTVSENRATPEAVICEGSTPKEYIIKKENTHPFHRMWYVEPYVGAGFIFGEIENNTSELLYGSSFNVDFGFKWRYQIARHFGLILNTDFAYNRYAIRDGMQNNIFDFQVDFDPDYVIHHERYRTWAFGVAVGGRVNFGKMTDLSYWGYFKKAGKYIELLAYGNYNYSRYYDIEFYGPSNLETELQYKDPALFVPFDAGLQLSLGWNWFSIWSRYRLTDCFKSNHSQTKLPPFSAGIALSFGSTRL